MASTCSPLDAVDRALSLSMRYFMRIAIVAAAFALASAPAPAGESTWKPSAAEVEMCSSARCVVVTEELLALKVRAAAEALVKAHEEDGDPARCWERGT